MATLKRLTDNKEEGNFMDIEKMVALSNSIETKEFGVSSRESEVEKMWWILISPSGEIMEILYSMVGH